MRIVVDELPKGCGECLFWRGAICPLLNKVSYGTGSRLRGCPLVTDKCSSYETDREEVFGEFNEEDQGWNSDGWLQAGPD